MPLHKTPKFQNKLQAFAYENLSKKDLFELLKDAVLQTSHFLNEDDCFIEVVMNGRVALRTSDDDGISKKLAKAEKDAKKYK